MDRVERLRIYIDHCRNMAKLYVHGHPRWLFYSTMAHAKEQQMKILARNGKA